MFAHQQNDTIEIGQGSLKMWFSSTSGQLFRMHNNRTGVSLFSFSIAVPIFIELMKYGLFFVSEIDVQFYLGSPPLIPKLEQN